ncbi:hypothetical protein TWF694_006004 [Orbilia ellipsospora]|uniref:Uncharacterized protein n=1 Tax=Orbilia ellipsospora TaxID=2528407 RepID=A0AAV9WR75_9PEZI
MVGGGTMVNFLDPGRRDDDPGPSAASQTTLSQSRDGSRQPSSFQGLWDWLSRPTVIGADDVSSLLPEASPREASLPIEKAANGGKHRTWSGLD